MKVTQKGYSSRSTAIMQSVTFITSSIILLRYKCFSIYHSQPASLATPIIITYIVIYKYRLVGIFFFHASQNLGDLHVQNIAFAWLGQQYSSNRKHDCSKHANKSTMMQAYNAHFISTVFFSYLRVNFKI